MKTKILSILTVVTLLSFPSVNFGQAPTLGTAANFVLFSTNGSVSNSGISQVTGNVGTNNGSSTAFGNVNGVMHDNDGASAQCAADLLIAYNQLNSTVPDFVQAPLLGNGDTLIAGVYSISGATTLNLNLILNAKGNPKAVFVFLIQGSLSTNAGSKIKLINGARASNVYWKVEGLVSMASGTTMRGTIIANNAAINMNTGDTLEGRALSTAGAITIDGVLAYTPVGADSPFLQGPAAPTLGTAACYSIFSSDGAVSNTGISHILGDVGSNNGSATGFDALLVTGAIHAIPDVSTAKCSADLLKAYNEINALPYDIELLYPAQFGNNLVLTPHTYLMNGAATFTDTLFLNAQGNANAVFVIQINGALSTSTYSNVVLLNGALSKNVYWKIEGAVSINNYSVFRGTIICNNGALGALNAGVTLDGRALTTTGALTTTAMSTTMIPVCNSSVVSIITTEPLNKIVCAGSSASFNVVATGTGLSYQWRNGNVNLSDGGNISGAASSTLTINPVSTANVATNYNVLISGLNVPNDTSNFVSLLVNVSPSITTQPTNQTACAGSSVNFSASAVGTSLTYQWKKGSLNLSNTGNISGATSSSLTINPVNISDIASDYNLAITGTCSPVSSSINVSLSLCTTTGITALTDGNRGEAVFIYPNPFANQIYIKVNEVMQINKAELRIYNVLGTQVMNATIIKQLSIIETENLPSGIYFYDIVNNNRTIQSGRLISQ